MELNSTYLAVSRLNHSIYPNPIDMLAENTNGGVNHIQTGLFTSASYNASNNIMEEFSWEYPPGYRFRPSDDELIVHYLMNRIKDLPLPHDKIKDVNLYLSPPDKLAAEYTAVEENEWYFFTPRDRKYPNGDRPDRGVGKDQNKTGYWKATGADNEVFHKGNPVGSKKSLVYYQIQGNPAKGAKTNWIMHEYRVLEIPDKKRKKTHPNDMKLDDWVLCKIYNKSDKATKSSTKSKTKNRSKPKTTNSDDDDSHTTPELVEPSQLPQPNAKMDNMKEEANTKAMADDFDYDSIFSNEDFLSFLDAGSREMYHLGSHCNLEPQPLHF